MHQRVCRIGPKASPLARKDKSQSSRLIDLSQQSWPGIPDVGGRTQQFKYRDLSTRHAMRLRGFDRDDVR